MSKERGMARKLHREAVRNRLAALRCPGCARRNVLTLVNGNGVCSNCGHRVARDLYENVEK
jgi:ribosomal protein L37AE/L43A